MDRLKSEELLVASVSLQMTLEALDNVKDSKFYKHSVKQKVNNLQKEIETILSNEFEDIYMEEEDIFSIYMSRLGDISAWIANAPFADVLRLGDALREGTLRIEDK